MSRLQSLTLHNFKSFAGTTRVDLRARSEGEFTSIMGPNGSGKSNLMDALAFVIGTPVGDLRCHSSQDLCFDGTTAAWVEASLNIDGSLKIFRRKVLGGYEIDGSETTESMYRSEWTKIGVSSQALVYQGDVERLATMSPKELTALMEESNHSRYDELSEERDDVSKELSLIESERRLASDDVEECSQVVATNETASGLKLQLQKSVKRYYDLSFKAQECRRNEIKSELRVSKDRARRAREARELADADRRRAQRAFAEVRRQLERARRAEAEAASEIADAQRGGAPAARKAALAREESEALSSMISIAHNEVETAEKELLHSQELSRNVSRAAAQIPAALRQLHADLQAKWMAEHAEEATRAASVKLSVINARQTSSAASADLVEARRHRDELDDRRKLVEQKLKAREEQRDDTTQRLHEIREELKEIATAGQDLAQKKQELGSKLKEAQENQRVVDEGRQDRERQTKMLTTLDFLRQQCPGVRDTVGGLLTPQNRSDAPGLDRLLGRHFDSIVVDTRETALACVELLKSEQRGQFTFLALDRLKVPHIDASLRRRADVRLALDSVSGSATNPTVRLVGAYVLRDACFVESVSMAMNLRREDSSLRGIRMATPEGALVSGSGLVSGGEPNRRFGSRNAASAQRKVRNLGQQLQQVIDTIEGCGDREETANGDIARLTRLEESLGSEIETLQANLSSLTKDLEYYVQKTSTSEERATALLENLQKAENELKTLSDSREKFFTPFTREAKCNLSDYEKIESSGELARHQRRVEDAVQQAQDKLDGAKGRLDSLEKSRSALESAAERYESEAAETDPQVALNRRRAAQTRMSQLRELLEERHDELRSFEEAAESLGEPVTRAEHDVDRFNELLRKCRDEYRKLAKHANSDGAYVPPFDRDAESQEQGDSDESESEESDAEYEEPMDEDEDEDEDVEERMEQDNPTTASLSDLEKRAQVEKDQMGEISSKLAALATSRQAESQLSQASKRLASGEAKLRELRDRLSSIELELSQARSERANKLNTTINKVSEAVSEVYRKLTRDGLGEASITAVNSDEPWSDGVVFSVMPPRKPSGPLSRLSGGERAVASLALLLALHRIQPSPFLALDEVDAALDFDNVAMVGQHLAKCCPNVQLLVISHSPRTFRQADSLVGVYQTPLKAGSRILTWAITA